MIIQQDKVDVSVHGAQKTQEFKMQATAKSFSIMMDGLYSNKIAACIRELSTNASDAHMLAGYPEKPFHIKLPNSIEPTFRIRDYGVGLSDDDIYGIYTTFFKSTKEDSNDFTGFLGLGSKAFFSITDSANITSYFNGVRTVYVAFLNENRIPSLSTFSSMPTDEPNGLEIEVAIKEDETKYFRDEVNNQLKYFKVKPTISGDSQFEWDLEEEYVYEGTNGDWKMVGAGRYDTIRAVQGQVAYPISTYNLDTKSVNLDPALKALLQTNLLLTFDIGEININPSRESLSYDSSTINNILKKAKNVLKELPQQIAAKLESIETEWEARLAYNEICRSLGGSGTALLRKIEETGLIKWRDVDINSLELKLPMNLFSSYKSFDKNGFRKWKKNNHRLVTNQHSEEDPYWMFKVQKDKLIVYATGEDKAVDARTKQYCIDNSRFNVHIVTSHGPEDKFEEIRAALGFPDMIRASDLEKVRREKPNNPTDKSIRVQYYTEGWTKTDRWSSFETVEDLNTLEGLYVNLDRVKVMHNEIEVKDFNDIIRLLERLQILDEDTTIYGLRAQNQKRTHKLEYLPDFIQRKIDEFGLKINLFEVSVFSNQINDDMSFRKDILRLMPKSSDFYKVAKAIDENIDNNLSVNDVKKLNRVGVVLSGRNMYKLTKKVHDKYPMVAGSRYRCSDKDIINYCMQVDELEKLKS
jgi:hypothetical protein